MGYLTCSWDALPERARERLITEVLRLSWVNFKAWQKSQKLPKDQRKSKWEFIKDQGIRNETATELKNRLSIEATVGPEEKKSDEVAPVAEATEGAAQYYWVDKSALGIQEI